MYFSIIIPVYNRPDEIKELLESLLLSNYKEVYEVVIVEDGSSITCDTIVKDFSDKLNISYYFKANSGPGDSRNFGMKKAKGDYFIIFDSDCIIPNQYLSEVEKELKSNYVDCFGGPDKALKSFSNIQKAINFAMTSFLTTGGIRGGSEKIDKFQPRSFNMGISKKAFEKSKGFGNIHPGEDPDLSIRLWKMGFETRLFSSAFVYHKRRIDWDKFSTQVSKFGKARPILNHWYPEYKKITYWFPTLFVIGFIISVGLLFILFDWALKFYFLYFIIIFIVSSIQNKNPIIGFLSIVAVWKQFFGYGFGFLNSFFKINILGKKPEDAFPELFFKVSNTEDNFERKNSVNLNQDESINKSVEKALDKIITPMQKLVNPIEKKTKIVGLTGGIGSGKTTVANYLKSKGIPVYISDVEAKKVMEFPEIIEQISNTFGTDLIDSDKSLNREKLASIVFNAPDKLKQLNAIVHPAVKKHFDNWIIKHQKDAIIVKEAAILFESGSYKDCDFIITVSAPLETRIERVLKRDTTSREKILQRINNQLSDEERSARSQYVINNEDFEDTKKQVDEILILLKNK
jgi:dephospho-CoA kinase